MTIAALPARGIGSRGWTLGVLTAVYLVNFIDRQILPILLPQIKAEFGLSDTLLGLLVGPTFAVFYAGLGLPLALLADRVDRRKLIAGALALFSAMTIACGFAAQFWHLVVARILTGVGEAGTGPASQAMIADLYPPERRGRAQAVYATGVNMGVLVAFAAGGVVADAYGWRTAFLLAGLPGLVLVSVLLATVRDPGRGATDAARADDRVATPREVARLLWASRAFRFMALGACTTCFTGYALGAFFPSFLVRSHGLSTTQTGLAMALTMGVGGAIGTFAAGLVADRRGGRDVGWYAYIPAIAAALPLPLAPVCFLSGNTTLALACAVLPLALTAAFIGPTIAAIQRLVPLRSRATVVAALILIDNVVGLGLGPQFVGVLSDVWRPTLGEDSLRWAMLAAMAGSLLSIGGFLLAAPHLRREIAQREAVPPANG